MHILISALKFTLPLPVWYLWISILSRTHKYSLRRTSLWNIGLSLEPLLVLQIRFGDPLQSPFQKAEPPDTLYFFFFNNIEPSRWSSWTIEKIIYSFKLTRPLSFLSVWNHLSFSFSLKDNSWNCFCRYFPFYCSTFVWRFVGTCRANLSAM